jgi:hypothetical protein
VRETQSTETHSTDTKRGEAQTDPILPARIEAKLARAVRAAERAMVQIETTTPASPQFRERVRLWFAARRHRRQVRRLDRALRDGRARASEQASAALLAVLTERIANLETHVSASAVSEAINIASRVRSDYERHVTRLIEMHDSAHDKVSFWTTRLAVAEQCGAADLADEVRAVIAVWERRERTALAAVNQCEAARGRIDDALQQLTQLAERLDNK